MSHKPCQCGRPALNNAPVCAECHAVIRRAAKRLKAFHANGNDPYPGGSYTGMGKPLQSAGNRAGERHALVGSFYFDQSTGSMWIKTDKAWVCLKGNYGNEKYDAVRV